jgi:hypothetical protein
MSSDPNSTAGVEKFLPANGPVVRRVRAYYAPVNRASATPTIFDPAASGGFSLDAPPAPWLDLGWVENFLRRSASVYAPLRSGSPAVTQVQVREEIEATVSLAFSGWGKLQMALSSGSQHMNLLTEASGAAANGSGGTAAAALTLQSGMTASVLMVTPTQAESFVNGQMVAVDVDYAGQTGFVGSGVSAAYITSAAAVNSDANYIRRVSFNVGRVNFVNMVTGELHLADPLIAGVPTNGMKLSTMSGFVDREGGKFFHEWSALFVMDGELGDRVLLHYPRLQAMHSAAETVAALSAPLERMQLSAEFRALPVTDAIDGETVLCYRSYLPAPAVCIR